MIFKGNCSTHAAAVLLALSANAFLVGCDTPTATQEVPSATASLVGKSGATMTGSLILSGNPTQALQACTKQYADSLVTAMVTAPAGTANYIPQFSSSTQLVNSPIAVSTTAVGIGTTSPQTVLHVNGVTTAGTTTETFRVQAGADADNSGSAVRIIHGNNRGMILTGGREVGDRAVASIGITDAVGTTVPANITLIQEVSGFAAATKTRVGFGTSAPAAPVDVNGEIKLSTGTLACAVGTEGAQRYNSTIKEMEVCDGSTWHSVVPSGTHCGVYTSNAVLVLCKGLNPAVACPAGYTQTLLSYMDDNAGPNYICFKD